MDDHHILSTPAVHGDPQARVTRSSGDVSRQLIRDALIEQRSQRHAAPTLDELVRITGLSKTAVRYHVKWLQAKGEVRYETRRAVVLVDGMQSCEAAS